MSKPFVVVFVLMCFLALGVAASAEGENALPLFQEGVNAQATFSDIPADHLASDAVQHLKELGVVQGYPDGKFRGNDYVTRYELALVLSRIVDSLKATFELPQAEPNQEEGSSVAPSEAQGKNTQVQENLNLDGFISKDSPLLVEPDNKASREDVTSSVAFVIARLIELVAPTSEDLVVHFEEPTLQKD